jgi:hypothetical protein
VEELRNHHFATSSNFIYSNFSGAVAVRYDYTSFLSIFMDGAIKSLQQTGECNQQITIGLIA